MKLLLDAHTFLWFVWDDAQLSANAKALIVDAANQKFISHPMLLPLAMPTRQRQGKQHWMADDFDAPLEDFKEYME